MENWSASKTDPDARERAEQIIKDALRVVMGGISISPQDSDCLAFVRKLLSGTLPISSGSFQKHTNWTRI